MSQRSHVGSGSFDSGSSPDATEKAASATALLVNAIKDGNGDLLEPAVRLLREAVAGLADHDVNRTAALANIGAAYLTRFRQGRGDTADLAHAVTAFTEAMDAVVDPGHRGPVLTNLRTAHWLLYRRDGDPADLDRAIDVGERLIEVLGGDDPGQVDHRLFLADAYERRFEQNDALSDLSRVIDLRESALDSVSGDDPDHLRLLAGLAGSVQLRFELAGSAEDLQRAIQLGEHLVEAAADDQALRVAAVRALRAAHQRRFERRGELDDLDRAVELGEEALDRTPPDRPEHQSDLATLIDFYRLRFERTSVPADLDRSLVLIERFASTFPEDHPDHCDVLINLAGKYRQRYDLVSDPEDLERAIRTYEHVLGIAPPARDTQAALLTGLAGAFLQRFDRAYTREDIDRAVDLNEKAVATATGGGPHLGRCLSNLSNCYRTRFEHLGAPEDLDQAIEAGERSVAAASADTAGLINLGNAYRLRFEATGRPADLDRAIEIGEQAVAAPETDPNAIAAALAALGAAYYRRFERDGQLHDLNRAVDVAEEALARTPAQHSAQGRRAANLSGYHYARYVRLNEGPDLDRAISLGEQAIAVTPASSPERSGIFSNLSLCYRARFDTGLEQKDLDRATAAAQEAVVTSQTSVAQGQMLANLSTVLQGRFEHTGRLSDLDRAIEAAERALDVTPADHYSRGNVLSSVAICRRLQVEAGQRVSQEVLDTLSRHVSGALTSSAQGHMSALAAAGMLAGAMNDQTTAVDLLDRAVALLPSITPRAVDRADREHRLGRHGNLVSEAVAAHCAVADPAGAVEVAELGRGILLSHQLESRTDLTDLSRVDARLADRLARLWDRINVSDEPAARLAPLWAEHDELLTMIRQLPGFDRFLLPPRLPDLRPAAVGGAVLLVNVSTRRGDGIIITSGNAPISVPLPDLDRDDVERRARALLDATHDRSLSGSLRRRRIIQDVLGWLWDTIAAPMLDALPPLESKARLPRVWWMPTGVLGLFPLHVAGRAGAEGAMDRVISSYTPTLRTLDHMRRRPAALVRRQLTVALEHTPRLPDLPGTVAEATDLHHRHPDSTPLLNAAASTGNVLAALEHATWAHFACHAHADLTTPSNGGLSLHDNRLPISRISRLRLDNAELAFLSACSTAHRGWRHADESIHLASAFHLAGFRHVIASLWPLDDQAAAVAARSFYSRLPDTPTADQAADALHATIVDLREKHPDRPDLWAPLIHSGP